MTTSQISQRVGSQTSIHVDKNGVEYFAFTRETRPNSKGLPAYTTTFVMLNHKANKRTKLTATEGYRQGGVLETQYTNERACAGYSIRDKKFDTLEETLLALKKRIQKELPKDIAENWVNELFT